MGICRNTGHELYPCSCPKGRLLTFYRANSFDEDHSDALQRMTAEETKCDKCQEGVVRDGDWNSLNERQKKQRIKELFRHKFPGLTNRRGLIGDVRRIKNSVDALVWDYVGEIHFNKKICSKLQINLPDEVKSMWGKTIHDISQTLTLKIQIEKYEE